MPEADERRRNAGRPDGLTAYVQAARDTAPEGRETEISVLSVAYAAWEDGRDPADVWREVEHGV